MKKKTPNQNPFNIFQLGQEEKDFIQFTTSTQIPRSKSDQKKTKVMILKELFGRRNAFLCFKQEILNEKIRVRKNVQIHRVFLLGLSHFDASSIVVR